MNKEIQQEAERILPLTKLAPDASDIFKKQIAQTADVTALSNRMAFIEGATFAQQKQDERMIEFAEWIMNEWLHSDGLWYRQTIYEEMRIGRPISDLPTIFNTEKGY